MCYAELLRKKGKLKMAMRCYKEILKLQPENAETHLYLVQANLNLGFLNEALRHAVTAQKILKDDPRVHFLLGKIYFAKGLAPRALKEFTLVAGTATDPDMISWAELMRRRLSRKI
jgi:tetratricopeptide (TPR) repeat protein